MFRHLTRFATVALLACPAIAAAEPVKLKLAFFTSDRASVYHAAIKPFVDAVNSDGKGIVHVEVYFSGVLGKAQDEQPQMVLDGVADIAFIIPGLTRDRFPDNAVIELPGLFNGMREATLVTTRLMGAGRFRGYEQFIVLGAYGSELESIHTRPPVKSLVDLKGMQIRVNNATAGLALTHLGMKPVVMEIHKISSAISNGSIGGAALPLTMLFEFGVGRVATYHYYLLTSSAPMALVMNRKKFESLPEAARNIIRKYSGEWTADQFITVREKVESDVMKQLKSDNRRHFLVPSQADLQQARVAFQAVTEEVVARDPYNRSLLDAVRSEIRKLRAVE